MRGGGGGGGQLTTPSPFYLKKMVALLCNIVGNGRQRICACAGNDSAWYLVFYFHTKRACPVKYSYWSARLLLKLLDPPLQLPSLTLVQGLKPEDKTGDKNYFLL